MTDGDLRVGRLLPSRLQTEVSPLLAWPRSSRPSGRHLLPGREDLGLESVDVLGDVGGGDVVLVVPPGRDGRGRPRDSDGDDGLAGEAGLELTSYREVEAAGGGDAAAGLDGVRAETLGLLGLEAQLVTRDGGGLVPTEALVNAGVLVVRLLKVKRRVSTQCGVEAELAASHLQILDGAGRVVAPGVPLVPLLVVAASLLVALSLLLLSGVLGLLAVRDDGDVGRLRLAPGHRQGRVATQLGLDSEASLERLRGEGRVGDTTDGTEGRTDPGGLQTGTRLLVHSGLH